MRNSLFRVSAAWLCIMALVALGCYLCGVYPITALALALVLIAVGWVLCWRVEYGFRH